MENSNKLKAAKIAMKFSKNVPFFESLQECYEYFGEKFITYDDYFNHLPNKTLVLIVIYTFFYQRNKNFDFVNSLDGKIFFTNLLHSTGAEYSETCEYCEDGRRECGECDGRGEIICGECGGEGEVSCDDCDGDGVFIDGEVCDTCQGGGKLTCGDCDGEEYISCGECDGDGSVHCWECDGEGEIPTDKTIYEVSTYCSIDKKFYEICESIIDTEEGISEESLDLLMNPERTFKSTTHEDQDELESFVDNDTFYCSDLEILENANVHIVFSYRKSKGFYINYNPSHYTT